MGIFECQKVTLQLGNKIILCDFNFSFHGPGIILLEGENGVGKSSALKMFAGFLIPNAGNIMFEGKTVDQMSAVEFSFFTTTSLGLLNELTGMEHIRIIAKSLKVSDEFLQQKLTEYQRVPIFSEILHKRVADFSQGMRQFLRLFLHLFFEPKIVFLDEPFLYLSPSLKDFIQKQIENAATRSLVLITDQKFTWEPLIKSSKIILGEN